ncbi:MAG: hypothetical protein WCN27_04340 [Alphaproteobacteria bacterium]
MTRKLHVSHQFIHEDAAAQHTFGEGVITCLTDHAGDFAHLPFTVAVLTTANDLLHSTDLLYIANGESAKGNFINAEYDWKQKFTQTAVYVDFTANGNQAIIDNSGFISTGGTSSPNQHLGALADFKSHGNTAAAGAVVSSVEGHAGLRAYLFTLLNIGATLAVVGNQITVSMGGVVVCSFIVNTRSSVNFVGMASLTKMLAQATGFNTAGLGDFSSAISVSVP